MDLREAREGQSAPRHPWETARFWFFRRILASLPPGPSGGAILDVGAGDAWFSRTFVAIHAPLWKIHCVDLHYSDEALNALNATSQRITFSREFPDEAVYDGALLLDVLEHVEDDLGLLSRTCRSVVVGGWVLISVPAWPRLYSSHDRFLHHFRRYTFAGLRNLTNQSDLVQLRYGGLFLSLLPIRMLQVWFDHKQAGAQEQGVGTWEGGPIMTNILYRLLVLDAWICETLSRVAIPIPGLSWWILCQKL